MGTQNPHPPFPSSNIRSGRPSSCSSSTCSPSSTSSAQKRKGFPMDPWSSWSECPCYCAPNPTPKWDITQTLSHNSTENPHLLLLQLDTWSNWSYTTYIMTLGWRTKSWKRLSSNSRTEREPRTQLPKWTVLCMTPLDITITTTTGKATNKLNLGKIDIYSAF